DSQSNGFEGWYVDDVQLSTAARWSDYYSFTGTANDTLSVAFQATGAGTAQIALEDSAGRFLTSGVPASYPYAVISDLLLPASGTYYVHVTGANTPSYGYAVVRNAEFDVEPNDDVPFSQPVLSKQI